MLRSSLLAPYKWLVHGFSTRLGGVSPAFGPVPQSRVLGRTLRGKAAIKAGWKRVQGSRPGELNLGFTEEDTAANVQENRRLFQQLLKAQKLSWTEARQIHSSLVWRVPEQLQQDLAGDALWTQAEGFLLTVRTADCTPILLADIKQRRVAAIHAGWRGTLDRIVEKTVGELLRAGSRLADLRAVIGPGIRGCCYEVGPEVVQAFEARFDYAKALLSEAEDDPVRSRYPMLFMTGAPPGHPYDPRWNPETPARLDLAEANRQQLLKMGLQAAQIEVLPYCTACRTDLFFSHRREQGKTGRMAAAIGIRLGGLAE